MSIVKSEKECRLPLDEILVDGVEAGLVEDMKYRPNKYFHPIDELALEARTCVIRYQREISPVEGRISVEELKQLLHGVIDATQHQAHDQTFYLYPGVEAFGQTRRRNLRVALINSRPHSARERGEQELCVDAFLKLIAEHCPPAQRRVVRYNRPILTLRHLLQVLDYRPTSAFIWGIFFLVVLAAAGFFGLHQYGPPRIQKTLRNLTNRVSYAGKRVLRSASEEWFAELSEERQKVEYRYKPIPLSLVIQTETTELEQRRKLEKFLYQLLEEEFREFTPKTRYKLVFLDEKFNPEATKRWRTLCDLALPKGSCKPNSWLLTIENYRGGFRPLLQAVREAMQKAQGDLKLDYKFTGMLGAFQLNVKASTKPEPRPAQKEPQPSKSPTTREPTPKGQPAPRPRDVAPKAPPAPRPEGSPQQTPPAMPPAPTQPPQDRPN